MGLSPGSRLDHYEIIDLIGKGGMGEVYRAKDTRLPREAAIKISAQQFSERFAREAKIIASLNHTNICTLYDVGLNYLVMELVEGPTLGDRLKSGPMSLEEASGVAHQIADSLDYAHEKGVVHRDLKPGNIKIRPDGVVKVLDFGLAKVGGMPVAQSDESPTITVGQTAAGVILGTAAYMAPEQAKGKDVDKRADIYAFGLLFYEMLSGARAHSGETLQDTMASVLKDEPDLSKVPVQAHRLLKRCLEKDPRKRLRHIGDVMSLLDEAPASGASFQLATGASAPGKRWLWPGIATAVILAGAVLAVWAPWRSQPAGPAMRFEVVPPEKTKFTRVSTPNVSPDGRWIVFSAVDADGVARYWIRSLDSTVVRPLLGTEGLAATPPPAFWSADSRYIAYGRQNTLFKIDIAGGPPQAVTQAAGIGNAAHGTWNREGVIVFGTNGTALRRVLATGGTAEPVTVLNAARGESAHRWVEFLPDGKHFLYHRTSTKPEYEGVYVGSLDVKPEEQIDKPLLLTNRQGIYAPSPEGKAGYLLFLRDTTLFAQSFDPRRLALSGDPLTVANGVGSFPGARHGLFSVSETGILAYQPGEGGSRAQLTWFDPKGIKAGTLGEPGDYGQPAISPDGSRVAVAMGLGGARDIWIIDVARGVPTRFTFDPGNDDNPVWSADGKNVVFSSSRGGESNLYVRPADGLSEEHVIFKSPNNKVPTGFSRDGRFLLFQDIAPATSSDLWVLSDPLSGSDQSKAKALLATEFFESAGTLSPDGRWLAYVSQESGTPEVYVRPFSQEAQAGGSKWIISKATGLNPRWRADGRELFYATIRFEQMAVEIDTSKGFQPGAPRKLFDAALTTPNLWDMTPDGKRFLYVSPLRAEQQAPFVVQLNWQAALKK